MFCFKQKTAYGVRISDWSSDCALPIYRGLKAGSEIGGEGQFPGQHIDELGGAAIEGCRGGRGGFGGLGKERGGGDRGGKEERSDQGGAEAGHGVILSFSPLPLKGRGLVQPQASIAASSRLAAFAWMNWNRCSGCLPLSRQTRSLTSWLSSSSFGRVTRHITHA